MLSTFSILRIRALQRRPIFIQYGAIPHIHGPLKELLDQNFRNDWIGIGTPLTWPPYSPNLNSCYFYLWEHLESFVSQVPGTCVEHLKNTVREAIQSINEN